MALIFVGAPGCKLVALMGGRAGLPVGYAGSSVDGRWTGRVVRLNVYDAEGRSHAAHALEIVDGPVMPGGAHEIRGAGKLPILVEQRDEVYWVRDVDHAEEGTLVEITGTMRSAIARVGRESDRDGAMASRVREHQIHNEHLLITRGQRKLLDEH